MKLPAGLPHDCHEFSTLLYDAIFSLVHSLFGYFASHGILLVWYWFHFLSGDLLWLRIVTDFVLTISFYSEFPDKARNIPSWTVALYRSNKILTLLPHHTSADWYRTRIRWGFGPLNIIHPPIWKYCHVPGCEVSRKNATGRWSEPTCSWMIFTRHCTLYIALAL